MAQVTTHFTPEQVEGAFRRLQGALRAGRVLQGHPREARMGDDTFGLTPLEGLPTSKGEHRGEHFSTLAPEFMLMHSEAFWPLGGAYAFKHGWTRNYLYVTMRGLMAVIVPCTGEPFMRGEFDPDPA